MDTKKHRGIWGVGLALALLCLASTGVFAQSDSGGPVSTGVVATITALDARTGMATLQTEAGEVFALPKESLWHVGHKVECDRITTAPRPRLQHCQPWESAHTAGDTSVQPSRADVPAAREGDVRFLAAPAATPSAECKKLSKAVVDLERDRARAASDAPYLPRLEAELATARQALASCEAQGQ